MDQEKIGRFISNSRKKVKLTQDQLAEKLGVSKNAVSKWERGLNLPDVSLMQELCGILKISLNELFAGEYKKKAPARVRKRKKKLLRKFCSILLLITLFCFISDYILIENGYKVDYRLKYTQEYIAGHNNVKGNVNIDYFLSKSSDFDIGANKYGWAVFKNPRKAFKTFKIKYKTALKLIQEEYHLKPFSIFNFKSYEIYGWQVTTGTEKEKEDAIFVSAFLGIYESSLNTIDTQINIGL